MRLLKDATEEKKFDVRVIERNVTRGRTTQTEVDKFKTQLPDDSENLTVVTLDSLLDDKTL